MSSIISVHGHLGGSQHRRGVARVFELLLKDARFTIVSMEAKLPFGRNGFEYVADVYAMAVAPSGKVVIEIDGKTGHASKRAVQLDKERDAECRKRNIAVVRFTVKDIVSRKPLTDSQILDEVEYRLKKI